MAKGDQGNYHNFRLSKSNAQHVSVNKILRDLNPNVVKSKNQYIVDAIEYYTNALDKDDLTLTNWWFHSLVEENYLQPADL